MSKRFHSLPTPVIKNRLTAFDLKKKDSELPQGDTDLFDSEEVTFPCMFCDDSVSEAAVDAHLGLCEQNSLPSPDSVKNIKYCIEYIQRFFTNTPEVTAENQIRFQLLDFKCSQIIESSEEAYKFIKTTSESIENMLKDYQGGSYLRICIEKVLFYSKKLMQALERPM